MAKIIDFPMSDLDYVFVKLKKQTGIDYKKMLLGTKVERDKENKLFTEKMKDYKE